MHLNSKNTPRAAKVKAPCVRVMAFTENADGSSTVQDFVYPESVGTIDDWTVESLQNAGVAVDEVSSPYMHGNFADVNKTMSAAADKLVSEAEIKDINNLE